MGDSQDMRPEKTWMWSQALNLLQDAERLQRQFFHQGAQGASWEPPVDVYQSGEDVWIFLAVPGVPADHVDVVLDGSTLVVRGERPLPRVAQGAVIHRLARVGRGFDCLGLGPAAGDHSGCGGRWRVSAARSDRDSVGQPRP